MDFPKIELIDPVAETNRLRKNLIYLSILSTIINLIQYKSFIFPKSSDSILVILLRYFVEHGHFLTTLILSFLTLYLLAIYLYQLKIVAIDRHNGSRKFQVEEIVSRYQDNVPALNKLAKLHENTVMKTFDIKDDELRTTLQKEIINISSLSTKILKSRLTQIKTRRKKESLQNHVPTLLAATSLLTSIFVMNNYINQ